MATPTIPSNAAELAEMLADPAKAKDVVGSPEDLATFITEYAKAAG
jgi:hypothetical protein